MTELTGKIFGKLRISLSALLSFVFASILTGSAFAYIPPARMILQRTAENSGSGVYTIEQEVQFTNGQDALFLKETWQVENDRVLKVTVSGTKDLKDQIKMQFLYNGGQRWTLNNGRTSQRISEDFFEKYFHFRTADYFGNALIQAHILPPGALAKKPLPKNVENMKYEPESFVRLSRTGTVVNYAFGTPSPEEGALNPGIWIEQDQFLVRKLRLPSQVEVTADNYNPYARGLNFPKTRVVRWGQNSVTMRLIGITAHKGPAGNTFQAGALDTNLKLDGLAGQPAKDVVLEFYSRFR
jgi:hypothetical protein